MYVIICGKVNQLCKGFVFCGDLNKWGTDLNKIRRDNTLQSSDAEITTDQGFSNKKRYCTKQQKNILQEQSSWLWIILNIILPHKAT